MHRRIYQKSHLIYKTKPIDTIVDVLLLSIEEEFSTLTSKKKNAYFFCLNDLKNSLLTTRNNKSINNLIETLEIWKKEKLHGFELNELICINWEKTQKRTFRFFSCCINENAHSQSILYTVNTAINELESLKNFQPPVFTPRRTISSTLT